MTRQIATEQNQTRSHKHWTPQETATLERMYKNGEQLKRIARAVGHSVASVMSKRRALGLIRTKNTKWPEAEKAYLARNIHRLRTEYIAKKLGRSVKAVLTMAHHIGLKIRREQ